ncbi:MAG TPA: hypothetical protein VF221_22010, partial [Chloroflexota bacterium]
SASVDQHAATGNLASRWSHYLSHGRNRNDNLDIWARWLLEVRHGGDADCLQRTLDELAPVRDRVLDKASLGESDVVLDVGAGDGLIAFGALPRIGANGRVIFSDVSRDLLEHCAKLTE